MLVYVMSVSSADFRFLKGSELVYSILASSTLTGISTQSLPVKTGGVNSSSWSLLGSIAGTLTSRLESMDA